MTIMALHDKPVDDVPGTPPEFMALLRRGLAPDPAARPQTAAAFRDALLALPGPPTAPSARNLHAIDADHTINPAAPHPTSPAYLAAQVSGTGRHTVSHAASHSVSHSASHPVNRPSARFIGLAAALVVVIAAAAILAVRLFPNTTAAPGTGSTPGQATSQAAAAQGTSPETVGAFGIATVQAGCPAAAVQSARARCPASPECWAGLVEISGVMSAEPLPCDQSHDWETFAIAIMPAGAQTFDEPTLAENPTVRALCSLPVLLTSRRVDARRIPAGSWQIEVLPPTEAAYDSGARTYRCVAGVTDSQAATSQFRR
jgi:Septum formation